jgi:hypothetical protein
MTNAFMIHRRMNLMTSLSTKGSIIFSALLAQGIHLTNPPVDLQIGHWNVVQKKGVKIECVALK